MTELFMALAADGKLPEWIRILPLGQVDLTDHREPFRVDLAAVDSIVQRFTAGGVDLVIDYEHQSLMGERAPAAGWIKELQGREDGLWGRVDWTPQGAEYLKNREYRYFSPVLRLDPETRRPTALLHLGLTNTPAIRHLEPLVAKAQEHKGPQAETPAPQQEEEATAMLKKLIAKLSLPPETTEDQVLALVAERVQEAVALKQQTAVLPEIAQAAGLEATATPSQIKGAVLALKSGAEQLTGLRTDLEALKAEQSQGQAQKAVDEARTARKITPAQEAWALKYAMNDLEGFKTYVAAAPEILSDQELKHPRGGGGKDGLSQDEMAACKQAGITPEAFKGSREYLIEQGMLRGEG